MSQEPPSEAKKRRSRDDLDPSAIITVSQCWTPSTHLVAALETMGMAQVNENGTNRKITQAKAMALSKVSSKDIAAATDQGMVIAKRKTTPNVNSKAKAGVLAQGKTQVPDRLSSVPEGEESVEMGIGANINKDDSVLVDNGSSQSNKNLVNSFDDIYAPNRPDNTNTYAITAYAGADDDYPMDVEKNASNSETEEDYEEEDVEEGEMPLQPSGPTTKQATTISANAQLTQISELIFLIPVHDQWEQKTTHRHSVSFNATADQAILSIQTMIGSVKIPMDKRPPPVVKLTKFGSLKISLKTIQDWDQLKTIWKAEYKKKQVVYDINVIMTKKMIKDVEEAVKKYMNTGKKTKASSKAVRKKSPYLSDESSDDSWGPGDRRDLNAESVKYKGKIQLLMHCWLCPVHVSKICLGDKSKDIHFLVTFAGELSWALAMIQGVEGVDIENPPHSDPFKAWYLKTIIFPCHAGARMLNHYDTNAGGTHVAINMPPKVFS
ncbi:hypothetical protein K439DRAFT_1611058 [Ramaria rubella]|nr:hypothetical protein K439DRAFT_1611058 [Ramaria rubella]